MLKRFIFSVVVIGVGLTACTKQNGQTNTGCRPQLCTDLFATVGIRFVDANGNGLAGVSNFSVVDMRTGQEFHPSQFPVACCGSFNIVTDSEKSDLSTEGDNLKVTATNPNSHNTASAFVKVAGGCLCHVTRIAGPDTLMIK